MRLRGCTTNSLREAVRVLHRTEDLLAKPERWTAGAWARDRAGKPVLPLARSAQAWCVAGAIIRANHDLFALERLRVELAASTRAPVAIKGTKRVVVALRVIALPIAFAVIAAKGRAPTRSGAAGAELDSLEVDLSAIPVWVNDLSQTNHEHILFALSWAIDEVRTELRARRLSAETSSE